MHIKQVIVEGFKCYKDRIEAEPFSPKHNVVGECSCVALARHSAWRPAVCS